MVLPMADGCSYTGHGILHEGTPTLASGYTPGAVLGCRCSSRRASG